MFLTALQIANNLTVSGRRPFRIDDALGIRWLTAVDESNSQSNLRYVRVVNAHGARSPLMTVRPMNLDDVDRRIAYFHDSSDDFLLQLGVDRLLLPERQDWKENYRLDFERPIEERQGYGVMWLVDDEVVGWSNVDQINFGRQAFMHLHIADPNDRASGFGAHCVILAVRHFFQVLGLERIYCEPNALNVAPNRTLQRAGFRYEFSHIATPGQLNFEQATTRWVITGPPPLPTGR